MADKSAPICREGPNTVDSQVIPIIFLPGVMGSRLKIDGSPDWDPDARWRMPDRWIVGGAGRRRDNLNFRKPGSVIDSDVTHSVPEDWDAEPGQDGVGFGSVAKGFYGDFLRNFLTKRTFCVQTPIFAVGYDWRQSNEESGQYLELKIKQILQVRKAKKFVLITHSMGGLVARSFLKYYPPFADKCAGVIHICQPAAGAPIFYLRMYIGAEKEGEKDPALKKIQGLPFRLLMGLDGEDFAKVMSVLPGPCQLAPSSGYVYQEGDWIGRINKIEWSPFHIDITLWPHEKIYQSYVSKQYPPGVCWAIAGTDGENELRERMFEAGKFHAWLGKYRHPRTWTIYHGNLPTVLCVCFLGDMAIDDPYDRNPDRVIADPELGGDGTVPAMSGGFLFAATAEVVDDTGTKFVSDSSIRQCKLSDAVTAEHADICSDTTLQQVVESMLLVALGCCGEVKPAADESLYIAGDKDSSRVADAGSDTDDPVLADADESSAWAKWAKTLPPDAFQGGVDAPGQDSGQDNALADSSGEEKADGGPSDGSEVAEADESQSGSGVDNTNNPDDWSPEDTEA